MIAERGKAEREQAKRNRVPTTPQRVVRLEDAEEDDKL